MQIVADLERMRAETLPHFSLPDAELDRSYGPGKWTVRQILNHLSDSEVVFLYRVRRVIAQDHQVIWATEQDSWATRLGYDSAPLDLARDVYAATRSAVIHSARRHYEKDGAKPFVHSEMGARTLRDEFDKVVWHNRNHLDQIARALA